MKRLEKITMGRTLIIFRHVLAVLFLSAIFNPAQALTIEITSGGDNPVVISNIPFAFSATNSTKEDVAAIIDSDLQRSGYFSPLARNQMFARPTTAADIDFANWRKVASEYIVIGRVNNSSKGVEVEYELHNVISQERVLAGSIEGSNSQLRVIAHKISDIIFKKITGIDGIFSSSILYVSSQKLGSGRFNYQLLKADADAENPKILLESSEPITSPSWSPDKSRIAYTSFENGKAEIYIQSIASGSRVRVASYPGLNSAPSWSPDGSKLAFTLSKDGNPEVYVLHIASKNLQRITSNSYAIDTEASWYPDGQHLVFTSDRGGQPQLYRVNINTREVARLTYNGNYNARGQIFPDGKGMALIHRQGSAYRIATQDLQTGQLTILSDTSQDESPSVAGNSNMIMYATNRQGRSTLAVVSVDGRTRYYLPSRSRSVRDPSWSR